MKHLCDLPIPVIREIFVGHPYELWTISEKLDGSYLRAGLDESARFYTLRKGNTRYYEMDDWPDMPWTNAFRSAHIALRDFFTILVETGRIKLTDQYLDFEVLNGEMPNSIHYGFLMTNSLIITGGNFKLEETDVNISRLSYGSIFHSIGMFTVHIDAWTTHDMGKTKIKTPTTSTWSVDIGRTRAYSPSRLLDNRTTSIMSWLDAPAGFHDFVANNGDILDMKMNRRPEWIPEDRWKAERVELIESAKELRESKREDFQVLCNIAARITKRLIPQLRRVASMDPTNMEGVVVKAKQGTGHIMFKMVDKEHFAPLNNFTHIVRYWLQGGRRPERPCFLSRTAHWPTEKRLERLEVLRARYVRNASKLTMVSRYGFTRYTNYDLNKRTLLLFAELKERIQNGRCGFQGQSTSDRTGGDSADS